MAKFRIKPESIRKVKAGIEAATEKKKKQLALALGMWADELVAEIQDELLRIGAFDQGILSAATTRTAVQFVGNKLRVVIFNSMEYAFVIEFGRVPGKAPPLVPLIGWAGRKGIIHSLPRNVSFSGDFAKKWAASAAIWRNIKAGRHSGGKKKPITDPQIRDLVIVRAIADKIATRGTKGRHPFANSFDRKARTFARDIAQTMRLMAR